MNLLTKKSGQIESVLSKGQASKTRKTNLLSGLQSTLDGLRKEEEVLQNVRSEVVAIMANLEAENEQFGKELSSISAVRSNIEKLLGSEG